MSGPEVPMNEKRLREHFLGAAPTPEAVREAIDVAINALPRLAERYDEEKLPRASAIAREAFETLDAWRSSLLEKGGPDAVPVEDLQRAAAPDSEAGYVREAGEPGLVRSGDDHAAPAVQVAPPLEKGARFTPEEREALERAILCCRCAVMDTTAATLAAMLDGDDTPGGRT